MILASHKAFAITLLLLGKISVSLQKRPSCVHHLDIYEPSLLETLSCGFMTSGNSGGVDRGAITTGSNSPSKINIEFNVKISQPRWISMHDH